MDDGDITPLVENCEKDVERARAKLSEKQQIWRHKRQDKERIFAIPVGDRGSSESNRKKSEQAEAKADLEYNRALAALKSAEQALLDEQRSVAAGELLNKLEIQSLVAAAAQAVSVVEDIMTETTSLVAETAVKTSGIQDSGLTEAMSNMQSVADEVTILLTDVEQGHAAIASATTKAEAMAAAEKTSNTAKSAQEAFDKARAAASHVNAMLDIYRQTQTIDIAAVDGLFSSVKTVVADLDHVLVELKEACAGVEDEEIIGAMEDIAKEALALVRPRLIQAEEAKCAALTARDSATAGIAVDVLREAKDGVNTVLTQTREASTSFKATAVAGYRVLEVMKGQWTIISNAKTTGAAFVETASKRAGDIPGTEMIVQAMGTTLQEIDEVNASAEQVRIAAIAANTLEELSTAGERLKAVSVSATLAVERIKSCMAELDILVAKNSAMDVDTPDESGKGSERKTLAKEKKKSAKKPAKTANEMEREKEISQAEVALVLYQDLLAQAVHNLNLPGLGLSAEERIQLETTVFKSKKSIESLEVSLAGLRQEGAAKAAKRKRDPSEDTLAAAELARKEEIDKKIKKSLEEDTEDSTSSTNWNSKWNTLDDEKKEGLRLKAAEAIETYLQDKENTIPDSIRRMIREIPEFAVEAVTTTRGMAQHILWTGAGNVQCLFHGLKRSVKNLRDGFPDQQMGHRIHGVPAGKGTESLVSGTLKCGCTLDSALWDLIIWKTMMVSSDNPAVIPNSEYLGTNMLTPRHRAFFIQAYSCDTRLTLDDIFTNGDVEFGSDLYFHGLQTTQLHRQLASVNALGVGLGLAQVKITPAESELNGGDEFSQYINPAALK